MSWTRRSTRRAGAAAVLTAALAVSALAAAQPAAAVPGGWIDPVFGTDGRLAVPGASSNGRNVALDASGRLLVLAGQGSGDVLRRYTVNGLPDSGFTAAALPDGDYGQPLVAADGSIYLGRAGAPAAVVKLTATGALDTGFGAGGTLTLAGPASGASVPVSGLVQRSDGVLVALTGATLQAFSATGAAATAFGGGAVAVTPAATPQGRGQLLAAAGTAVLVEVAGPSGPAMARYTAAGTLDTGYGSGGLAALPAWAGPAVTSTADGSSFVGGWAPDAALGGNWTRPAVLHLTAAGSPDAGFGSAGVVTGPATANPRQALSVTVSGDTVSLGSIQVVPSHNAAVLDRFTATGADASFGSGGELFDPPVGLGHDRVNALLTQPDGRVVVVLDGATSTADPISTVLTRLMPGSIAPGGSFVPVPPTLLLDTRIGLGAAKAAIAPQGTVTVQVTGRGQVPAGASAVVLNVTVNQPKAPGYITAYPSGTDRPTASNVNFVTGQTVPNSVTVALGDDGAVTLFNGSAGTAHLLAAVSGYYLGGYAANAGAFTAIAPTRVLDTRSGLGAPKAAVPAGGDVTLQITSDADDAQIPTTAGAVVLNLTVNQPQKAGWLSAYPSTGTLPASSNLNFTPGQTVPNSVTVKLGDTGAVTIHNGSGGTVQVIADVAGWYVAGTPTGPGTFVALDPSRVLDTRIGLGAAKGAVAARGVTSFTAVGDGKAVPAGAEALVLNLTVTAATAPGYLAAVDPEQVGGAAADLAALPVSALNFVAGHDVANQAVVPVSDGATTIYNGSAGATQSIADVMGYFRG